MIVPPLGSSGVPFIRNGCGCSDRRGGDARGQAGLDGNSGASAESLLDELAQGSDVYSKDGLELSAMSSAAPLSCPGGSRRLSVDKVYRSEARGRYMESRKSFELRMKSVLVSWVAGKLGLFMAEFGSGLRCEEAENCDVAEETMTHLGWVLPTAWTKSKCEMELDLSRFTMKSGVFVYEELATTPVKWPMSLPVPHPFGVPKIPLGKKKGVPLQPKAKPFEGNVSYPWGYLELALGGSIEFKCVCPDPF